MKQPTGNRHTRHLQHLFYALACFAMLAVCGCSATKYVPEGDALFWKYTVDLKSEKKLQDKTIVKTELDGTVLPKPNAKFLGLPFKLWIHGMVGPTEKKKGFKHWLSYTVGQPPVLFSQVDTGRIQGVMRNRMHNRGYYQHQVSSKTEVKNKKAVVNFSVVLQEPYKIRKIQYPQEDSLSIFADIRETQSQSALKEGDQYNLQLMLGERERIDERLKNRGYYNFNPDMLIFRVDSTVGNRQVDIFLRVKEDAPIAGLMKYHIEDVYIFTNYSLTDTLPAIDTIKYRDFYYIPNENYVRARHLVNSVFVERGRPFSHRNHTLTISRLMSMGSFQYANIKYTADTLNPYLLDAQIYLTPELKKSLRVETQMVSKSNNFAGPGLITSFRNRNALKGSELLALNLVTSFESQVTGRGSGLNSYELGLNLELAFPRFVAPFRIRNPRSNQSPRTTARLGYSFLNRVEYYQMNSYQASWGYRWRPLRTVTLDLTPLNIQFVELSNTTQKFDSILRVNPFLRRSFEQQYIFGSIYQLTYSNQMYKWRTHHFFNNIALDLSGNSINAIKSLLGAEPPTIQEPRTIATTPGFFDKPYSQYTRIENDFRYYYNFTNKSQFAYRLITGAGFAYGNSVTMPYVKQFNIGGSNSIRAFRARSIGPGTYKIPKNLDQSYFDQTGDIKLETNLEYRFPLSGIFRGAIFLDAGNVWMRKPDPDRPGGEFKGVSSLSDLAVGTGVGLRIDVEFFVLRFDLGIPLRRPTDTGDSSSGLGNFGSFGGQNGMILNIAIGYPF